MSRIYCPYDVGAPQDWLSGAGLASDRKACAVPLGLNCGMNNFVITDCCRRASAQVPESNATNTFINGTISVCALPQAASNATYQFFQDCILNYPGRDGGFRCNDITAINRGPHCYSLNSVRTPPVAAPVGQQICVTGAVANSSSVQQRCCGNTPVSFEGGCWQYCIAPAGPDVIRCISSGFRDNNVSYGQLACFNGTTTSSGAAAATNGATPAINTGIGPMVGLFAVLAWAMGF